MDSELDFEQVYAAYQLPIHSYLARLTGSKESEDLTQEVFIKVGEALKSFRNESQVSTWIYRIATNVAIDRMRSRSFNHKAAEIYDVSEVDLNSNNERSGKRQRSIEEQVVRQEMNECIQACIETLSEKYRIVLVLSEMEGFKKSEIAAILGLSIDAVKIRLHRAREKLKSALTEHCNFYRTECCGRLACEPKISIAKIKAIAAKKH